MFGAINMNGRVYDPATAQFFSPDPFVQSVGNLANYNRYSYGLNNPMIYTDPSGYRHKTAQEMEREAAMIGDYWDGRVTNFFGSYGRGGGGFSFWSYSSSSGYREGYRGGYSDDGYYDGPVGWHPAGSVRSLETDIPLTLKMGYYFAKQQGWEGNYDDFIALYNQRTANSSYNGTFTLHTFESFFVPFGQGSRQTGSINLLLESGLGGGINTSGINNWVNGIGVGLSGMSLSVGKAIARENAYLNTNSIIKPTQTMLKVGPQNLLVPNTISTTLTRTGIGLSLISTSVTIIDGVVNGWENHHTADLVINGVMASVSVVCPPAGLVLGGLYFVGDITMQYFYGQSITQKLFD